MFHKSFLGTKDNQSEEFPEKKSTYLEWEPGAVLILRLKAVEKTQLEDLLILSFDIFKKSNF